MTTSAPQRGAGSDDPIGRDFGQDRPTGLSDRSYVRTGPSNPEVLEFTGRVAPVLSDPQSEGDLAVRERRRTRRERRPSGRSDREGARTTGGAGRVRWAVGADCCGALGCRETGGLVAVVTDRGERVLCLECAEGWLG